MVVVGNSTMRDLFFRQSVYSIGQSPYQSITEIEMAQGKRANTSLLETGRRCLLPIHPEAAVYGVPVISGHVGADAAACMLAVDLAHEDRLVAVMDIGTNTELILGNRHRILAASCPAGPAFEGGAIACGMPALDGAIENVRIDDDGIFHLDVIGGGAPRRHLRLGPDRMMSELLRTGRMNERGRFENDLYRITLAPDVYFLESDVSELAQAKGANVAGLQTVCSNYGIVVRRYRGLLPGRRFRPSYRCARRPSASGSSPPFPNRASCRWVTRPSRVRPWRCSPPASAASWKKWCLRVEHCRLETHPRFFDFFVDGCQFGPVESGHQVAE